MKNGEMKQSKKLLEYIAGIAGNCLTVCPSQEGKIRLHLWIRTCEVLDIWSHHMGMLRQCPQESPLANGQILIDGQLSKGMISGILDKISQAAREESQGVSWIRWVNQGCVESLSSSDDWMQGHVQSSSGTKRVQGWSYSKNLIQGSVYMSGIERPRRKSTCRRMFRFLFKHLNRFKEDHEGTSSLAQGGAEIREDKEMQKMSRLAQASRGVGTKEGLWTWTKQVEFCEGLYTQDRECNDLVNHIEGVFRYFIVDVVDHGSTPDVARCGRELGEQFLSHEQR
ncbi:hypothetical protein F2Q70_00005638 [Brassica cretica]|uniref:Uncharacterized protein n=1 Tax=Brassica cretica TaxID=69181 RepID=A0A8S9IXI9_BRACR|nr:hypothetical protein F2Q70_00005638 [Brassica cretica]